MKSTYTTTAELAPTPRKDLSEQCAKHGENGDDARLTIDHLVGRKQLRRGVKRTIAKREDDRWKMNHRDRMTRRKKDIWFTEDSQSRADGDNE